jgi:uncharacterized membrane protein (DUF485 family)
MIMPGQVKETTKEKDTRDTHSFVAVYKGGGVHVFLLICLMIVLWFFLLLLSLISFSKGASAYLGAGLIIGFGVFFACLLVSGILEYDSKTYFKVNPKGLTVQDTYTWGIKGKSLTIQQSEMLRVYSNIKSEFPSFFIVYMHDGKKKYVGLNKSMITDYNELLYALMEIAPVVNEGTWRYKTVKDAEENLKK